MTAAIFNTGNVGDTLCSRQHNLENFCCDFRWFGEELLSVQMESIMNQLDEVVIRRYSNVNAVSLGVIPAGQKSYTAAERKLKTATRPNLLLRLEVWREVQSH
jgi:hypothetical protein